MAASNIAQLEGLISSSVNKEYPDYPPTEAQFEEMATKIRDLMHPMYPVDDIEFAEIRRRLRARVAVRDRKSVV